MKTKMEVVFCGWIVSWLCLVLLSCSCSWSWVEAQQPYLDNRQLDCYNPKYNSTTLGFACNGADSPCQSYLTFRSKPPFTTPVSISRLLNSQPKLIASINNLTSQFATIPTDTLLIIPVNCSCLGPLSQHNATYTLENGQTYLVVANDTYQGLTTCQSLMAQNSVDSRNLTPGLDLLVPLRCACPTPNQTASGVNYLLTYLTSWFDTISYIADIFHVDEQVVLDANQLSPTDTIHPFNPILVPLTTPPTKIELPSPPPPPSPQSLPLTPPTKPPSSKKWVFVGVGTGLALLLVAAFLFCFLLRRSKKPQPKTTFLPPSTDYSPMPDINKSWSTSVSSHGFRDAVESLTVYGFRDVQTATNNFSQENRITGSVYRASFKGDEAAVKVTKGDVLSEINILKKISHTNIIRLSGFCVNEGNTYLVYEFAHNGALTDWLYSKTKNHHYGVSFAWKQRVQVAYDVANALDYLHKYVNPPYIHKNLKSSNILLDANMRGKIANFGLARSLNEDDQLQLTRHVVGTHGYMAPEYIENGVITPQLDVYAFGVVMLELLSGREAATADQNHNGDELLSALVNKVLEGSNVREKLKGFMDPTLRNEYPLDLAFALVQLAKSCVSRDLNARPSMSEVFTTLSKIQSSLSDWDPSDELDTSGSLSTGFQKIIQRGTLRSPSFTLVRSIQLNIQLGYAQEFLYKICKSMQVNQPYNFVQHQISKISPFPHDADMPDRLNQFVS